MFIEYIFGSVFFVLPVVGILVMLVKAGIRNIVEDRLCEEELGVSSISMKTRMKNRVSKGVGDKTRTIHSSNVHRYEHMEPRIFTSKLVHIDCFKNIHRRAHINRRSGARIDVVDTVRKEYFHQRAGP